MRVLLLVVLGVVACRSTAIPVRPDAAAAPPDAGADRTAPPPDEAPADVPAPGPDLPEPADAAPDTASLADATWPDDCRPLSCDQPGGKYCGLIGDGCGHALDCGGCPGQIACGAVRPGVCICVGAQCGDLPITCERPEGYRYCGLIGDGTGGQLDCGPCPRPHQCGIEGTPYVCGPCEARRTECRPSSGGRYCGVIGDGCGGPLDCGPCPPGNTCGGGGVASVCGPGLPALPPPPIVVVPPPPPWPAPPPPPP